MTVRSIARALLLVPLIAGTAFAQYSGGVGLATGTRVRLVAPSVFPERTTATVLAAQNDTIVVARSGGAVSLSIPMNAVQKLEISEGRNRWKWGAIGSLAGLFIGGILGGMEGGHNDNTGIGAAAGFFAGAILGIPGGAVIGALAAPEHWVNYPLPSAH